MFHSALFIVILLINQSTRTVADDPCRYSGSKGVIDLSSIGNLDGTARFSDISPGVTSNYKYSYNPCKPFTEAFCQNVAACQVSNDLVYRFTIGLQETAVWNPGSGLGEKPTITYTFNEKQTIVTLVCGDDEPQFEALGENPTNTYKFRLTHKCACWDGCTAATNTTTSLPSTTNTRFPTTSCRYEGAKGVINLTSLGRLDNIPTFLDVSPGPNSLYKYSYNPCSPFSEGPACESVALCQMTNDLQWRYPLGSQKSFAWMDDGGFGNNPRITYKTDNRTSQVTLVCGGEIPVFLALGEYSTDFYNFMLIHKCACWNAC